MADPRLTSMHSGPNGAENSRFGAGIPVETRETYTLRPGDTVRGVVQQDGREYVGVTTGDHRIVLVPHSGLVLEGASAAPNPSKALVSIRAAPLAQAHTAAAPGTAPAPSERKRKLAMVAGIGLGVVAAVGSIVAGVIASRAEPEESPLDALLDEPAPSRRRKKRTSEDAD